MGQNGSMGTTAINILIKIILGIVGLWIGFAIPFFVFLVSGIHLLLVLLLALAITLVIIMRIHKKSFRFKIYVLVFLITIGLGIIFQIIYSMLGGWALFGS